MKKIFSVLAATVFTLLGMNFAIADKAGLERYTYIANIEQAAELDSLKLSVNNGKGYVYASICDHCEQNRLTLTKDTKFYVRDRKTKATTQLALTEMSKFQEKPATVFFDPVNNKITRIKVFVASL